MPSLRFLNDTLGNRYLAAIAPGRNILPIKRDSWNVYPALVTTSAAISIDSVQYNMVIQVLISHQRRYENADIFSNKTTSKSLTLRIRTRNVGFDIDFRTYLGDLTVKTWGRMEHRPLPLHQYKP